MTNRGGGGRLAIILLAAGLVIPYLTAAGAPAGASSASTAASSLGPGQVLVPGQSLSSPDGQIALTMQPDGNLVSYVTLDGQSRVLWASGTEDHPGSECVMQSDGDLVVYSSTGTALWSSGTAGHPGAVTQVQDDGNTVVYAPSGNPLWASETADSFVGADVGSALAPGEVLAPGELLQSPNGQYRLYETPDGALTLYQQSTDGIWWLLEGSATLAPDPGLPHFFPCALCVGTLAPGSFFIFQDDGNLVLYPPGGGPAEWSADVAGAGGVTLDLQDDGNLVLYGAPDPAGVAPVIWQTGTDEFRGTELGEGVSLQPGQFLLSPDGLFKFAVQTDGNFVIYAAGRAAAVWSSGTSGNPGAFLSMQHDGNLVLYAGPGEGFHQPSSLGPALWASGTDRQNTGDEVVAMAADDRPYVGWLSATGQSPDVLAPQLQAAASAYESAFAGTVPPEVIAANRAQLMALIATNVLGQNTAAIAATEAQYAEMWAREAAALWAANGHPYAAP